MRLIDADDNRKEFMERVYDILSDEPDNIKANMIIDAFDAMKVAYDVDKVVDQLKERANHILKEFVLVDNKALSVKEESLARIDEIEGNIEIVKAGGVNENR